MTYVKWEKGLSRALRSLSKEERADLLAYYKELYRDKEEVGIPAEEILQEFGSPQTCAKKFLQESDTPLSAKGRKKSIAWWVAICFLSPTVILPIYASLFAIAISLGAVTFSVGVSALAGALYTLAAPFFAMEGMPFFSIIAHMGIGFVVAGVCSLLTMAFGYLTKFAFKWTIQSLIYIYRRR